MSVDQKLKILFLAANPVNTTQLRLEEELRGIREALQLAQFRDRFEMEVVLAARIEDMRRAMLRFRPEVVHFAGHGEGGAIYLEDKDGNAHEVPGDALGEFFSIFPAVKCVVLNACYSEELSSAITQSVPYVIGMQAAVEDTAAISFAVAFYDGLGADTPYDVAFRLAANTLRLEGLPDAYTPVLVQNDKPSAKGDQVRPNTSVAVSLPATSQPETVAVSNLSITRLSGPQFKQFHEALLAAFDQESLTQMVRLEMGVNINSVAGGSNFSAIVFNLIDWAQRTGRLRELITAAASANGNSPEIKAFVASLHN